MLLVVQNPHHYPWRHAPSWVECSRSGAILQMGFIQSVARRRTRLRRRPIVIPGEAPSPQQWTIDDTRWPRVKRYTSAADPTMVVKSVNSLELCQTLFATQFPLEDYLESFMDPDANPVLSPYLSSVEPHLECLRDAGVKLPSDVEY